MNALVQGAGRGIGLALVAELVARGGGQVVATQRGESPALATLRDQAGDSVKLIQLELTCEASIAQAASRVREHVSCSRRSGQPSSCCRSLTA